MSGTCLFQIEVSYRYKVQRMCVVIVIWVGSEVHEELYDALAASRRIIDCTLYQVSYAHTNTFQAKG